jgi:hypothetical protein
LTKPRTSGISKTTDNLIIAATGHRPKKLGGYSDRILFRLTDLARAYFLRNNPGKVISGMALGWDTAIALAAIELKIPLIAAVPFPSQGGNWKNEADRTRYREILEQASEVHTISPDPYSAGKLQIRNCWMCDRADKIVALFDGTSGGTANCLKYATNQGKEIDNLWKSWVKYSGVIIRG